MNKITNITAFIIFLLLFLVLTNMSIATEDSSFMSDPMLAAWEEFSQRPQSKQLIRWLRCQARAKLTGAGCGEDLKARVPSYFGRLGIFITLRKGRKVRGCYGAFSHASADARAVLLDYLSGALTRDPRYEPIEPGELNDTDIIISVTAQPFAVSELDSIDTHRYGITVTCGEDTVVAYVPAEIRDAAHIQKLIQGKDCHLQAFRAITIR